MTSEILEVGTVIEMKGKKANTHRVLTTDFEHVLQSGMRPAVGSGIWEKIKAVQSDNVLDSKLSHQTSHCKDTGKKYREVIAW